MKIAQFIASSGWGGAEKLFFSLCNELVKTQEVTALVYEKSLILDHLDRRVKVVTLPNGGRRNPRLYWHLYKALKAGKFDVVHTHCGKASEIILNLSRVMDVHQVATKHNPRKGKVFQKIRWVNAVSEGVADSVGEGTPVIYNGVVHEVMDLSDERNETLSIVAIGRLDPIKAYDVLIEQVAKLEIEFHLSIIGDGPHEGDLREKIKTLNLEGRVSLPGFQEDIPKLMSEADLTVISSHSEGFSLVVVEAMFYAKVLLSTRVGVATILLDDDFLCDHDLLAESIARIGEDYASYRNRFKKIQETNREKLTIEVAAKAYVDFYGETLAG